MRNLKIRSSKIRDPKIRVVSLVVVRVRKVFGLTEWSIFQNVVKF